MLDEYFSPTVLKETDDQVAEADVDGDKFQITVGEVRKLYHEYLEVLNFIFAIDNNHFQLSYSDYQELPAITIEVLNMYKNEKAKLLAEKAKG